MALAITNVSVTTTSISFIANSNPAEYYKNWYYQVGTGAWKLINASQSYRYNVTITGLSENTSYKIGIKARKSSDNYEYFSPTVTVTTAKNTTPPVITASVTAIGTDRFTINGSTTYTCKTWQYQLNGGTWTSLSTSSSATSASKVITGLSENTTYTVRVRATRTYNNVTGTSGTVSATTTKSQTPPTVTASITAATAKGFTINGTANYPCRTWQYQIDGGAWQSLSDTTSANSVSKAISGLTPGQTYSVRVRATRTYNGVTGTSGAVSAATLGASILNSVSTLTADDATAKVTFNVTIPAGTGFTHALYIYEGIDFLVGITTAQMAGVTSSGSHTVNLTGAQKNVLLARMPDRKSFNGRFYLVTFDGGTTIGNWSEKFATIQTTTANSAPTFTGFTHSEQNAKVTAVVAGAYYVQSLSDIKIVCTAATAKNGSSISKYGATIGAKTVTSGSTTIAFGAPAVCGIDYTISVYAEDSRGYKTTITDTKTIGYYAWPQVLEWQARRKDSVGEQTALYVLGQVQYSAGATLKMAEYRIQPSDGSYGAWTELTPTSVASTVGGKRTYLYDEDDWETLDPGKSYTVQIRVQDTFDEYSSTVTFPITRGTPVMSIRDGRIGINNFNPQAALDVIGDIHGDNIRWGIIEKGSDANGSYIKLGDGTLVQFATKEVNLNSQAFQNITLPLAFVDTHFSIAFSLSRTTIGDDATDNSKWWDNAHYLTPYATARNQASMLYRGTNQGSTVKGYIHLTATGRWKE